MLLSNCASRHVTLYIIELLIGELYNQGRCDRHARQLYGSVAGNSGDIFFCHLFLPIYDFLCQILFFCANGDNDNQ